MKRNFLLMLLLTILPLAGLANDVVKVGGYDVILNTKWVMLPATGNATAPVAGSVKKTGNNSELLNQDVPQTVWKIGTDGLDKVTELSAVGNYFLKVTADNKSLFVPFTVGQEAAKVNPSEIPADGYQLGFEYIANKADFDASMASAHGGVNTYATANPDEMRWNANAGRFAMSSDKQAGDWPTWCTQEWRGAIYAPGVESEAGAWPQIFISPATPWLNVDGSRRNVYFQYDGGEMKDAECTFSRWAVISVPGVLGMDYAFRRGSGVIGELNGQTVHVIAGNSVNTPITTFDVSKLKVFFTPVVNPFLFGIALDHYETTYAGTDTPEPVVTTTFINDELQQPVQADLKWYNPQGVLMTPDGSHYDFGAVGTYTVIAVYSYQDKEYTAVAQYVVKPFEVTIGAGNLYKGFGDADPTTPSYGTVWTQLGEGDTMDDINITGLTVVRKTPTTDPTSGAVGAVIPYTIIEDNPSTGNPNYTLKVTPTDGNIYVTRKYLNEDEFTVTVNDDANIYDGTAQLPVVTVTRKGSNQALVPGTDFEVGLATTDPVQDNVNANVDKDGNLIGEKGHIQIIITGKGNYTSTVKENGVETEVPVEKEFDIAQRNIETVTVADIAAVTYNAQPQKPQPKVSFTDSKNNEYVLNHVLDSDKPVEFKYVYDKNVYASTPTGDNKYVATCTVEAVYTTVDNNKVYTGNFYGSQPKEFIINRFAFNLSPKSPFTKIFGDADPDFNAVANLTVTPAEEGATLPEALDAIAGWNLERVQGEHVGLYNLYFTTPVELGEQNPYLKAEPIVEGEPKSAPINNYTMTSTDGTFEIVNAEGVYFVSSKYVEKDYNGTNDVPFKGYYLYKRVGQDYVEIPEKIEVDGEVVDNPTFKLIAGPTKNVLNETANGAGRDVRRNWNGNIISWAILPDVTGLGTDEYTLATVDIHHGEGEHNGEGYMQVNPRNVVIVANDKSSEYGEAIVSVDATVYEKSTDNNADANGLLKNEAGVIQNAVLPANLASQLVYSLRARYNNNRNLQAGDPEGEYPIQFYNTQNNGNFNQVRLDGTYTIIPSTKVIKLAATGSKGYGEADADATWTVTAQLGKGTEFVAYTGQIPELFTQASTYARADAEDNGEAAESTHAMIFVESVRPAKIGGYNVDYTNSTASLSINKAGELVLTASNQIIDYGMLPQVGTDVVAPYLKINGAKNDLDQIKAKLVVAYPESGLIKNGATINIEYDETYVNANYTTVTVKPAKLYVNAVPAITLNRAPAAEKAPIAESYADIVKADAPKNNALQTIKDYDGVEGVTVNFAGGVKMYYEKWYAMVLPFETTVKEISSAFGYAVVELLDTNSERIHFKIQMNKIPANTPFIVKIIDDDVKYNETGKAEENVFKELDEVVFEDKEIVYNEDPSVLNTKAQAKFIGTYVGKTGFGANEYFFSMSYSADPEKYYYGSATNTTYLRPLGSYIQDLIGNGVREIIIEEPDGTITAINGVNEESSIANDRNAEGIYNLSGQRVNKAQKGIYIMNGKKVLVK